MARPMRRTTVIAGAGPDAIAVNPVTDKIYVANNDSSTVTVINGATNATATVTGAPYPRALSVNPVTDKIYVADTATMGHGNQRRGPWGDDHHAGG